MSQDLPTQYDPAAIERDIYRRWLDAGAFRAVPDARERRYVIMMPLPNVTGALHMGHAMDNVMQDLLVRWHRMLGDNTLWMPGTDHAGIATQAVVEKRLFELERKTRHDLGRAGLVRRIWEWKEQYQKRIVAQLEAMGCSCDWNRARFTMDRVCARAVRWTFFRMFKDGLVYRGSRLVNWDCHLQTAVADDEILYENVQGHFWHLRYPVIDPAPGEPRFVVVATTRPETMLGDTAVACHPDPAAQLEAVIAEARARLERAPAREKAELAAELERCEARRETHLPTLRQLVHMADQGRSVMLPLMNRPIPLIKDEWAKPEKGSGCVKITPAHDPNDYEVFQRHRHRIAIINILEPDGKLAEGVGDYAGMGRFEARDRVVRDLSALGLLEAVEDHLVEVGHSDRSKTPIEPFLSRQWFIRMGDVEGGIVCGRGTPRAFRAAGLAQAAMDAVDPTWRSPTGRQLTFHPDPVRYRNTYLNWLGEKRDWCISRQLWWGHRIPVWRATFAGPALTAAAAALQPHLGREDVCARIAAGESEGMALAAATALADIAAAGHGGGPVELLVCLRDEPAAAALGAALAAAGFEQDPDVLDTWFSSSLWPHSTLGWPDPATAEVDPGQAPLGATDAGPDCLSYYYPGSCLVTARDIITLWVARMHVMGLYNLGDLPFEDCFIHANILDGKGERMSKSKGNGIDPVDIIERYGADAMRYVLCEMQTGMQDIRLPVQAISPFTGDLLDLAAIQHGRSVFTYICPRTGREFDVLGTMPDVPAAKLISDRFDVGRNFCNKLLNAARFVLMNLAAAPFLPRTVAALPPEDCWILSRTARAVDQVTGGLEAYNPAAAITSAREFFWGELCDWYLELIKPRLKDPGEAGLARQVLAAVLDQVLRLFHPFTPFITEMLWARLGEQAPVRGIEAPLEPSDLLIRAAWPARRPDRHDPELEEQFGFLMEVIRAIRDIRSKHGVSPKAELRVRIRADGAAAVALRRLGRHVEHLARLEGMEVSAGAARSADAATAVVRDAEIFVAGVVDVAEERARLTKQRDQVAGRVEGARQKLANPAFLERARAEVVQKERERLAALEAELTTVEKHLAELG
ncbi:MAG: valine--tRNA ligase [Planctomycetes bacterium]|nr:valine--tRNA ligase [Planctomycetota bacterium]